MRFLKCEEPKPEEPACKAGWQADGSWVDFTTYHSASSIHPATCSGCTADPHKFGKKVAWVIADLNLKDGGWLTFNGIEGWHFTKLRKAAQVFDSREDAESLIARRKLTEVAIHQTI